MAGVLARRGDGLTEEHGAAVQSDGVHVIFGLSSEEARRQSELMLEDLGLQPTAVWMTSHAVSFRVDAQDASTVRSQLERMDFGSSWIVVPPGEPDYLYKQVFVPPIA
jgi:hypothetical protein